jgi:hypothetical protein
LYCQTDFAKLVTSPLAGEAALHSVIARMFPAEVVNVGTYFGRIESELEITIGIMLGRKQATEWLEGWILGCSPTVRTQ